METSRCIMSIKQINPPLDIGTINGFQYLAVSIESPPPNSPFEENFINVMVAGEKNPDNVVNFDSLLKMTQIVSIELDDKAMSRLRKMTV